MPTHQSGRGIRIKGQRPVQDLVAYGRYPAAAVGIEEAETPTGRAQFLRLPSREAPLTQTPPRLPARLIRPPAVGEKTTLPEHPPGALTEIDRALGVKAWELPEPNTQSTGVQPGHEPIVREPHCSGACAPLLFVVWKRSQQLPVRAQYAHQRRLTADRDVVSVRAEREPPGTLPSVVQLQRHRAGPAQLPSYEEPRYLAVRQLQAGGCIG